MCDHVENCCNVCPRPNGEKHVTKLRHSAVRKDFFNVVLRNGNCGCKQSRRRSNNSNDCWRPVVCLGDDRVHTGHQKDASSHHGGGVNERRYWSWSFHCIGQPEIEGKLRALTASANKQHQSNCGGCDVAD